MKTAILFTLIGLATIAVTYKTLTFIFPSDQQKVERIVEKYLKENMDDPGSYESVGWGEVDTLFHHVTGKIMGYQVLHKFRGRNAVGALVVSEESFELDTNLHIIHVLTKY